LVCCYLCFFFFATAGKPVAAGQKWRQSLSSSNAATPNNAKPQETAATYLLDLRAGYATLHDAFGGMGMTRYVKILRRITWSTPLVDELGDLVDELSASGRRRKRELTKLRIFLPGRVRHAQAHGSSRGCHRTGHPVATRERTFRSKARLQLELCSRPEHGHGDDIYISGTAKGLIQFDPNQERKVWLKEVAKENHSFRGQTSVILQKYVRG